MRLSGALIVKGLAIVFAPFPQCPLFPFVTSPRFAPILLPPISLLRPPIRIVSPALTHFQDVSIFCDISTYPFDGLSTIPFPSGSPTILIGII
jgi:hypothetical protein